MTSIQCIPFLFPGIENVRCLFTTRISRDENNRPGDANLALTSTDSPQQALSNRRELQDRFGIQRWREVRQVHGTDIFFADEPGEETGHRPPRADALATQEAGAGLMVKVADCQPVLVAHLSGRFIGAFHVGWRGNRSGAIQEWIEAMCRTYRILPGDIAAVRGPSLGPDKSEFVNFDKEWGQAFAAYLDPASQTVDLWRLTRDQLLDAGLDPSRIFSLDLCTYSLSETFFSHRRSRDQGRQAGIIWRHQG
jgi:hypothetical protein